MKRNTSGSRSVLIEVVVLMFFYLKLDGATDYANSQLGEEDRTAEGEQKDDADEGVGREERGVEATEIVCADERVLIDEQRAGRGETDEGERAGRGRQVERDERGEGGRVE